MAIDHEIIVNFGTSHSIIAPSRFKYDKGQILKFNDIELPEAYQVHFSNSVTGKSKTAIGNADGVEIYNEYFETGEDIWAWVYIQDTLTSARTKYTVRIPIKDRAEITDEEPTPEEQSAIDQAIAALNVAVEKTDEAVRQTGVDADRAEDAANRAETAASGTEEYAERAESAADRAETVATDADNYCERAETAAEDAETSAQDAARDADRAEQAAANAGYMWMEFDDRDHIIYTRTDAVDVDFRLDETGHLIMEAV